MQGFHYLKNVTTLELDQSVCIGCGRCLQVCPHQVFTMEGEKALVRVKDDCMECGACALNCPVKAISVDSGVGCASGLINEWLREHGFGGGHGTSCA
jgi:ferredoxin